MSKFHLPGHSRYMCCCRLIGMLFSDSGKGGVSTLVNVIAQKDLSKKATFQENYLPTPLGILVFLH